MSRRSVIGLVYMLQGISLLGVDPTPVLTRYGISLDTLDPAAEIERDQEMAILQEVAALIDNPLAGLSIGESISTAGYGALTMLLMTCDNTLEAMQAGVHYQQLTYLHGSLHIDDEGDFISLVICPLPMQEGVRRILIDGDLSGTIKLLRELQAQLGLKILAAAAEIWVPYPRPKEYRAYEDYYQCPVRFGTTEARIRIPKFILQLPFSTANRTANLLYRRQCDALLAQRYKYDGLTGKVLAYLELLNGGYPAADTVAKVMGMTGRSFRRQLSAEQTSFRQLLDRARYQKACSYLKDSSQSIDQLAQLLGYSEAASFIHAFQRWSGMSPSVFRKHQGFLGVERQ
jgi:AraC-like DNA-binding protein